MDDYLIWVQLITAISAASAAIASAYVARKTYTLHKQILLKKAIIEQISILLQKMYYLKSLTYQNALEMPDRDFSEIPNVISEVQRSILILESMISAPERKYIKTLREVINPLKQNQLFSSDKSTPNSAVAQQLDNAISAIQKIYHKQI